MAVIQVCILRPTLNYGKGVTWLDLSTRGCPIRIPRASAGIGAVLLVVRIPARLSAAGGNGTQRKQRYQARHKRAGANDDQAVKMSHAAGRMARRM